MCNEDPSPLCTLCSVRIKNYGFVCYDLMRDICESILETDLILYDENNSPSYFKTIFSFLESKKLLVTTDIGGDLIALRPNTYTGSYDRRERKFCWELHGS